MHALEWTKAVPGTNLLPYVRVSDDQDAAVVAGAFEGNAFIPGVYDPKTKTCVIKDDNAQEEEFYVLKRNAFIQLEWVAGKDGHLPVGSLQCGTCLNGTALYVGRFKCDGRLLCGKVNEHLGGCQVKILDQHHFSNRYEVLCLKTVPFGFYYDSLHAFKGYRSRRTLADPLTNFPERTRPSSDQNNVATPNSVTSHQSAAVTPYRVTSRPSTPLIPYRMTAHLNDAVTAIRAKSFPNSVVVSRSMTSFQNNSTTLRSRKRLWSPTLTWNQEEQSLFTPTGNAKPIQGKRLGKPKLNWQRQGNRLIRSPSKIIHQSCNK